MRMKLSPLFLLCTMALAAIPLAVFGATPEAGMASIGIVLASAFVASPGSVLTPMRLQFGRVGETILDANETAFFTRQLEAIKAKTYDIVYPELKAERLIPVSNEAGPGAQTITYRQYDQVGIAKIVSNYANDLPRADVLGKEFTSPVRSVGVSYGYNINEIRAAQMAGLPLPQRKANAARRANDELVNRIAWTGDDEHGLLGLLNHPNVTRASAPADGTAGSRAFSAKTPDQIIRDLNNMVANMMNLTKGVEVPDTLLLPVAQYAYLASTPRSANSDTTILAFFLANNPSIRRAEWLNECIDASVTLAPGTEDVAVAYKADPDKLTLEIPQPFEQFPEQAEALAFEVPCHSRCGGVIVYYPLSVYVLEGI
jgi:hypothetical protein